MAYAFEDDKSKVDVASLIKTKTVSNYNSPQITSNSSQPARFKAGIDLTENEIIGISIIIGSSFPFVGYWYDTEENEIILGLIYAGIYAGSSGTVPVGAISLTFSYIEKA